MIWLLIDIFVCVLCAFLAGIMIPQILLISFRRRLFDEVDERKIHKSSVPRLGGMAFVPVITFGICFMMGLAPLLGYSWELHAMNIDVTNVTFCYCALMMLYVVGLADDLIGVRYRAKFVVQVICAVMILYSGLTIHDFHGFLGLEEVPTVVVWITTVGLALFIINAINLIDGIDGLASGLSSVALVFYGVAFYMAGYHFYAVIAAATLGVLVPFFYYNVFGNAKKHKKIFMGDTGSLSIGLILTILGFKVMNMAPQRLPVDINLLVVAMSPLLIPCLDVIRVFVSRIRTGNSPFLPDKRHIHHRLLDMGLSQRAALLSILCASLALTAFNVVLSAWLNVNVVLALDMGIFYVSMKVVYWAGHRNK